MTPLPAGRLRCEVPVLRLPFTSAPWLASCYLASYLVAGSALFAIATAAVVGGLVLSQFTVTVPLVIGSAWIIRICAQAERGRTRLAGLPVPYLYREVTEPGLPAHIRIRCTDPAVVRDCAYLVLLYPVLLLLDTVALVVWLTLIAGITLPLWYRAASLGLPGVDTLSGTLVTCVVSLAMLPLGALLVVTAARLHLAVAQAVLRPLGDPLAQAKRVLATPGPLSTVPSTVRSGPITSTPAVPTSDGEAHERDTGPAG
ncbi:sensor domain-containing protein [Streptomyces sp. ET3-23]|uniref:sensor domain-containing protein n=1 Tax=Streptomyces sp. ET3-23 TaxID=2885643 RepID=UPI001D12A69B|nr:sensor domain-containing protein [Streptomyces sp. ET3-23]MCC2274650.1 sensor domain-containing protein [Streptomyces sp. ET3-23]